MTSRLMQTLPSRRRARIAPLPILLFLLLAGCASYRPLPLPEQAHLAADVSALRRSLPAAKGVPLRVIDPAKGLEPDDVAILAVLNDPGLQATRARLQVAGAQVFAAGLLPDPQLSASVDHPAPGGVGLVNGASLGLGLDLTPLITRQARLDAARAGRAQVNLEVLWQEWQVTQQARSLAVHFQLEQRQLGLLREMVRLDATRYEDSQRALEAGDITVDESGADLVALADAQRQVSDLEQTHAGTDLALHRLLGLAPDAPLPLAGPPSQVPPAPAQVRRYLALLPQRRPDLLALQAGYASQEAGVRAAILAQFPSVSVGISRARDTSRVYTSGFSIGLNLPLFSGNRGAIAAERATRAQLRAEYLARLDGAVSDVDRLLRLDDILSRAMALADQTVPELKRQVDLARPAFQAGDIDARSYLAIESAWYAKRLERIGLEQSLWDERLALQTLLALPAAEVTEHPAAADALPPQPPQGNAR
jgi:outer membrane protein, heavy metal efflux system